MAFWDIGLRNIVDVDGQLLGIDADVIDTASLLARANQSPDRQIWLVRAGERLPLQARQLVRLSEDEVLFFETAVVGENRQSVRLAA